MTSTECFHSRRRRWVRRAIAGVGNGYSRVHRSRRFKVRQGWFAHRGGVCRCGQVYKPARPSPESQRIWRGDE